MVRLRPARLWVNERKRRRLPRRPAAHYQEHHCENEAEDCKDPRQIDCSARDAAEAKHGGDQRYNEKCYGPRDHVASSLLLKLRLPLPLAARKCRGGDLPYSCPYDFGKRRLFTARRERGTRLSSETDMRVVR